MNLNYWKQQLGRVPDEVWKHSDDVETLVLADNGLTEIPSRIGELRNLRMLDLGHNALTSVPDLHAAFDFLYLHDNQLSSLPASIGNPRYLNLSENRFEEFPNVLCDLDRLIELRMTDNQLRSLPDCTASLQQLRELHLRNNALRTLPDAIGQLRELRQIDLRGNPLETLPLALLDLPRLEKLDLRWVEATPEVATRLEERGCVVYR